MGRDKYKTVEPYAIILRSSFTSLAKPAKESNIAVSRSLNTLSFFITTSNFGAEVECYISCELVSLDTA